MASGTPANNDFALLVAVLPPSLQEAVRRLPEAELLEVVMDLGRPPEARLVHGVARLSEAPVDQEALQAVLAHVGEVGGDNRAGIERTLHRVSAIRNRQGRVVGLTLRVGRAIQGTIDMLRDLVESGRNLLLLGRPGVGKTTKLREVARVLADALGKRVMVVDTSNEIGGDGDIPHPGIGGARRMQVSRPDRQHDVMIEAVENHMPEAIVVDEIGTAAEAAAARTIAERGVQLVATAHGNTLENLVLNPTLSDLVGGVQTVTLSDDEARRRGTQKTVTERKGTPTFDIVVEMVNRDEVRVHRDTGGAVDRLLTGVEVGGEKRRQQDGAVHVEAAPRVVEATPPGGRVPKGTPALGAPRPGPTRIAAHAVSRELLERVLRDLPVEAVVVGRPENAEVVLTLRSRANSPRLRRAAERVGARVLAIKRNSATEIRRALRTEFHLLEGVDPADVHAAVTDAEAAIQRVLAEGISLSLAPRPSRLRKLQHTLVVKNHLEAVSVGSEPVRHLVLYPLGTVLTEASDTAPEDVEALEPDDDLEDDDSLAADEETGDDEDSEASPSDEGISQPPRT
ncbi:AAA family ATPase [Corallococcus exiguus]|uniref:R3H domain-containing nucleic acid-binding protein n=1 Tax=Corallococcus exiguus TaxID=83462 RepID=UPI001471CF6A|nr:R3H domain-containing nucleic acid-binding protein [Corallococcus exiguus]NNB91125.1 AAA family ATPase [Corallococcus exiguus]NNB98510.1 AAA family ATPase [Corallococcus exiguus]NNC07879.1 AAA family ATPase [Corallococcus exiguus]